jgi:hypothetical protein
MAHGPKAPLAVLGHEADRLAADGHEALALQRGGSISLHASPLGGLRAVLVLPLAPGARAS